MAGKAQGQTLLLVLAIFDGSYVSELCLLAEMVHTQSLGQIQPFRALLQDSNANLAGYESKYHLALDLMLPYEVTLKSNSY